MSEEDDSRAVDVLPQSSSDAPKPPRIGIKAKGRILFIDPADVLTVEAQGNYVLLARFSGSDLLRETISSVAGKLAPFGFVRIHRSVLINSSFVDEIQPRETGEYILRMKSGREFTVSRTYKKNLRFLTSLWFGTGPFGEG
ncbi:MAG TPA: LytTR family DNA-binding domain-containing protein [Verrucomicrobiae bacterium]|nr:LytTR family DNA-binding domain-containing protein [Verrucomicrobiae bacterium]